eukprot:4089982-Prymnesium_polylepis.1
MCSEPCSTLAAAPVEMIASDRSVMLATRVRPSGGAARLTRRVRVRRMSSPDELLDGWDCQ